MLVDSNFTGFGCRSPYGERGLKFKEGTMVIIVVGSLSLRRAWIEIHWRYVRCSPGKSLSLRRAWIEIGWSASVMAAMRSLSLRRAWIEIRE